MYGAMVNHWLVDAPEVHHERIVASCFVSCVTRYRLLVGNTRADPCIRFLLVQLHLDSLIAKPTPKVLRKALHNLPNGLEALDNAYAEAMERIEGQVSDSQELAKRVLLWITCAERPLTTLELRHALGVEEGESAMDEDNLPQIENMVSVCAGLVTCDEESDIVRLVHYTTQEYFERTQTRWFPNAQHTIARVCFTYLSFDIFAAGACQEEEDLQERLTKNPLYEYVAQYWPDHVRAASLDVRDPLPRFLEDDAKASSCFQFTYWRVHPGYLLLYHATGMHLTAFFGLAETTEGLLKKGYQADSRDSEGVTPLFRAAEQNQTAIVQLLLEKGVDIESKDERKYTPLNKAVRNRHEAMVRLLLEKGADIESRNRWGATPLDEAVQNRHEAIVRLLLENGADIDSRSRGGATLLIKAVKDRCEAVVRLLLENGADIESHGLYGVPPLITAVQEEQEAMVRLLLEKGADIDSKNGMGETPLYIAVRNGHEAIVRLLLEKGADIYTKDRWGDTPLFEVRKGRAAILQLLIEKGADINSRNRWGDTPLTIAVLEGHEAGVRLLLEKGAEIESRDWNGWTPLSHAVKGWPRWDSSSWRREAMVRLLIEKGADSKSEDNKGRTPLWWATNVGKKDKGDEDFEKHPRIPQAVLQLLQ